MTGIKTISAVPAKIGTIVLMWVLGLGLIALFAWATQWRTTARIPTTGSAPSMAPNTTSALAALTAGLRGDTSSALTGLQAGRRSDAASALDAARRLAQVGQENAAGSLKTQYVTALNAIDSARQALWNGDPGGARSNLTTATHALQTAATAARTAADPEAPPRTVWDQYQGAQLLAADGRVIGEVQSIDNAAAPTVHVHIGSATGVFGFMNLGGHATTVPMDQVLWGRRQVLGYVFAVLTTSPTG